MSHLERKLFDREPLSVAELTDLLRTLITKQFSDVFVTGELSNVKYHHNRNAYFTVKDAKAQLECVMWADDVQRLKFKLINGQNVDLRGRLDVFPSWGKYQLHAKEVRPKGMGPLELAFRQMYDKLHAKGWFAAERKKPLPRFPRRVGVLASPSGAAVRDILHILHKQWPIAEVWVVPVPVQGDGAAEKMAHVVRWLNRLSVRPDVLILGRGGGSLEDLWSFNEEVLAAAIFASGIPIVCGVGHETDTTIADLVADLRATTPTAAAMQAVPRLADYRRSLSEHLLQLQQSMVACLQHEFDRLQCIRENKLFARPLERFMDLHQRVDGLEDQARTAVMRRLQGAEKSLAKYAAVLGALSPLNVLSRGYSLTRDIETKQPIVSSDQTTVGQHVETLLHQGRLVCRVEDVSKATPPG
jgi:exodeoxyribonuclease VII large subunit